jgi:hypothetical protein
MKKYLTKVINLLLIGCLCLVSESFVRAQNQTIYKADLITRNGKNINAEPVEISVEGETMKIQSKKKSGETKLIPFSSIETVDYTYSDRPRYTAATLSALAVGIVALPLFASKTKKNWLAVNAGEDSVLLQLQSSNYRMLLLTMRNKGVNITDSGDRDENEKKQKNDKQNKDKSP